MHMELNKNNRKMEQYYDKVEHQENLTRLYGTWEKCQVKTEWGVKKIESLNTISQMNVDKQKSNK